MLEGSFNNPAKPNCKIQLQLHIAQDDKVIMLNQYLSIQGVKGQVSQSLIDSYG